MAGLSDCIALAGLVAGFVGSMMMASVYISTVLICEISSTLIGIWRRDSQVIEDSVKINKANNTIIVKGLSLLVLGFLLQAVALVISIAT